MKWRRFVYGFGGSSWFLVFSFGGDIRPAMEFRRVSLVLMVVATIVAAGILPIFAIADREDTDRLAAVKQLEPLQRAWRGNHPQPP
jgi:hypothetical protein